MLGLANAIIRQLRVRKGVIALATVGVAILLHAAIAVIRYRRRDEGREEEEPFHPEPCESDDF